DDAQKQLIEAATAYVAATADFKKAVKDKFGAKGQHEVESLLELTPLGRFCLFIDTSVDKAPEEIDGDTAMIQPPDVTDLTFWLVKDGGVWKLSVKRMTENWTPEQYQDRTNLMRMAAEGLGHFSHAVANGKYANIAELKRDIAPLLRQNR